MDNVPSFDDPNKEIARRTVLTEAVAVLTKGRASAAVIPKSYVRRMQQHLLKRQMHREVVAELKESAIDQWESLHASRVTSKAAGDLKVAILCGPNPENDVAELIKLGVREENIWAFEARIKTYDEASQAALYSRWPNIKIFQCSATKYFERSRVCFDIIYLDFCKNVAAEATEIAKVLYFNSLSSIGILITNVCLPANETGYRQQRKNLTSLASLYLLEKDFVECGEVEGQYNFCKWSKLVFSNVEHYYGLFVTRLIFDLALVVVPIERCASFDTPLFNKAHLSDVYKGVLSTGVFANSEWSIGDVVTGGGKYSILRAMNKFFKNQREYKLAFGCDAAEFIRKFQPAANPDCKLLTLLTKFFYLMSNNHEENGFKNFSDPIKRMVELVEDSRENYHAFCDIFETQQLLDIIFYQNTSPYFPNKVVSRRWKYQANGKSNSMFLDMTVFDQCDYLIDWMPTMDMIASGFNDISRQLIFRFALDSVAKHLAHTNPEFLHFCNVIEFGSDEFPCHELTPREWIIAD